MKDDSTNNRDSSGIQDQADLAGKVDRILKMFNASDLDDIIKVIPVSSMKKITSKKRGNLVFGKSSNFPPQKQNYL